MPDGRKLFFTLFLAEMQDSLEDIEYLAGIYGNRFRNGEITTYVYNENKAFLKHEASGLKGLIAFIESVKPGDYKDVRELAQGMEYMLKKKAEESDNPAVIDQIVSRKIKKVLAYVLEEPEGSR
jgi:hypothetical protein